VSANRLEITGRIVDIQPLRYTLAGVPIVGFRVAHQSEQTEAQTTCRIECEMAVMAVDKMASRAARLQAGDEVRMEGFLARKGRTYPQLVLHAQRIQLLQRG
jgi:primosomal replication protein N